jgi:hypothetical protein
MQAWANLLRSADLAAGSRAHQDTLSVGDDLLDELVHPGPVIDGREGAGVVVQCPGDKRRVVLVFFHAVELCFRFGVPGMTPGGNCNQTLDAARGPVYQSITFRTQLQGSA